MLKILKENFEETRIILKKCYEKLKIFNKNSEKTYQKFKWFKKFWKKLLEIKEKNFLKLWELF